MSATSLRNALIKGISTVGPIDLVLNNLENEVRDYLTSEMMKFLGERQSKEIEHAMHAFFKEIMREHL